VASQAVEDTDTPPPARTRQEDAWAAVRATASGDSEAFGRLVRRYERLLRCIVHRRAGHRRGHLDAEEVINETWYQVLRRTAARDFDTSVRFSSWLGGICLNVLKQKQLRPSGTSLDLIAAAGGEFGPDPADGHEDPGHAVEHAELLTALADCLAQRTEADRRLYELVYLGGLTKVAVAKELGCSEAYVRQKLLPGLHQALARCLARKGFREAIAGGPE